MIEALSIAAHIIAFVLGVLLVVKTYSSALRSFVLPRSARDFISALVFIFVRHVFNFALRRTRTYAQRDRIMSMYSPVSLLLLPLMWLSLTLLGYTGIYWAIGVDTLGDALKISGSSLLTLGFAPVDGVVQTVFAFSEAALGLILVALLIAYLPTMYSAFSRREQAVSLLEVRAGSPPSAVEMIERYCRLGRLDQLTTVWTQWETWFVDVEESHTSLAPLAFFRSPQPEHCWVTAAGAVLDAAALMQSAVDMPADPQAALCIRAGYLTLRRIALFFNLRFSQQPTSGDPISITKEEFDEAYDHLKQNDVPVKPDKEQAWRDFAGWRVNYDSVLIEMCYLVMAPEAPWSSDRAYRNRPMGLMRVSIRQWLR